ncbi:FUN14 domain-containing protein 1 isoform X3 [Nylanderia fulva]|uniref:FUN14 domain-containing protein 1 isoform X3 n=1 Tax=Nylanderia fulva TaxID=613905 RepID=UPI0010FB2639|nr:FUN14 domain-containing protein 1 isoform X3 [Nylanderia fulva]
MPIKNVFRSGMKKLKRTKMTTPAAKKSKEDANKEVYSIDASKEAKSILEKILGDVSKSSATKQIIIGSTSGWVTGFITMKVGKVAACAVGGGIIMLQIAAHQGYIKVNWDKITRKAEKITDKVEEKITGEGPKFMDKVGKLWRNNSFIATSFLGGFIIGLSW